MFVIRSATPDDALGITIVNVYTWQTAYRGLMPERVIEERIENLPIRAQRCREALQESGNCFVAAEGNTVIGFCRYGASRSASYPDAGEVYALYVLKGYSGTGAGRALLSAAMNALRAQGYATMFINCLEGNPARGFYEHMGGQWVGNRTDELLGVSMTEDILLYSL
ncbi:MAG TPA: GNAT family N-acetyltransferase [Candidatus Limiplasma sp.]|nr:GNAT family N-acetyltransferase [Candidatus Limiplasma sp.]HPS81840.1 GNAT family N-acetyltransferase [Candidatus Limiplasma sp.]